MKASERVEAWTRAAACRYLSEENELEEALKVELIQCEPNERTPLWISEAFADAWLARKNPWKACPHLKHLSEKQHNWPENFWRYVDALAKSGAADTSLKELEQHKAKLSVHPKWHLARDLALKRMGRLDEAASSIREALRKFPKNAALQRRRADLDRKVQYVTQTEAGYRVSQSWQRISALKNQFAGERCFIIGNGPSLLGQDLKWLKNECTFVTNWFANHPDCREISPDFYCSCSSKLFEDENGNAKINPEFRALLLKYAADSHKIFSYKFKPLIDADPDFQSQKVDYLIFDNPKKKIHVEGGINPQLSSFQHNGYTGIMTFCFPLAFHMGFSEIYLLGCDCDYELTTSDRPKSYFYPPELHTSETTKFENLIREWAPGGPVFQAYEALRREAATRGVAVYNATAGGRLEVFPRIEFETMNPSPKSD